MWDLVPLRGISDLVLLIYCFILPVVADTYILYIAEISAIVVGSRYIIKKDRYNPMIITALTVRAPAPFKLRDLRSRRLDYVALNIHLLKLWAKIEKRIQNAKYRV